MKKIILMFVLFFYSATAHALLTIVAAENIYGSVIEQLGGPYVKVTSILNNPNQDPHLFSANISTVELMSTANLIVYNGANYDAWILPLLNTTANKTRNIMVVADLMHVKTGANPHIWYMPDTMPVFAKQITAWLSQHDTVHQSYFQQQLQQFNASYATVTAEVTRLHGRFNNTPVIATEPVFNYMAESIGLKIHALAFQINMMNDEPPTIEQIKEFEDDLKLHRVKVLIYNQQVKDELTDRLLAIARAEKIPVVGVSELLPANVNLAQWMSSELLELEKSLS